MTSIDLALEEDHHHHHHHVTMIEMCVVAFLLQIKNKNNDSDSVLLVCFSCFPAATSMSETLETLPINEHRDFEAIDSPLIISVPQESALGYIPYRKWKHIY